MTESIQFIKSQADFGAYLSSNVLVVAQFTATWCGPCRAILPVIDGLYTNPTYASVEFVRVDLDQQQAVLTKYSISSVPTFIYFNGGIEVARVSGANPQEITTNLDRLVESTPAITHKRHGNGIAAKVKADKWSQISHLIPKGYTILNDSIDFARFEALNIVCEATTGNLPTNVKDTLKRTSDPSTVITDTDSQGILYIPFLNITKMYSVLIKRSPTSPQWQRPTHIKIWSNQQAPPLFEAAMEDSACLHDQTITHGPPLEGADDEWIVCPVKYVKFQNCLSITIFIEGANEDVCTAWDKILLVGISGNLTELKTISRE